MYIDGTLVFSFSNADDPLHNESMSISGPGPFTASSTVSENMEGLFNHICEVTLIVDNMVIDSRTNGTTVEVVGRCHV